MFRYYPGPIAYRTLRTYSHSLAAITSELGLWNYLSATTIWCTPAPRFSNLFCAKYHCVNRAPRALGPRSSNGGHACLPTRCRRRSPGVHIGIGLIDAGVPATSRIRMSRKPVVDRTKELEDVFVTVTLDDEQSSPESKTDDPFYGPWVDQCM